MLDQFAPAHCLVTGGEIGHRFVQVALIEKKMIRVLQRHIGADLAQSFQSGGDVGLRLVFEECFVARLAETEAAVSTTALANVLKGMLRSEVRL